MQDGGNMTRKERVQRCVEFSNPDRPAIDLPDFAPGVEIYQKELGLPDKQAVAEFFGADTIRIEPDYTGPVPNPNWGKKFELRSDGYEYQTEDGYPCRELDAEQIRNLPSPPAPDPDWYDFDGYRSKCGKYIDRAVFTSTQHFIAIGAWELLAPQDEAMIMMLAEPDRMHAALDRQNEYNLSYMNRLMQQDPELPGYIFFNDDLCSQQGPMISPEQYDEFVYPRLREVSDLVHKHGRKMVLHCCGSIRDLLPHFIRAGVDILHPIQPGLPGNDLMELKKEFGRNIVLFSGLDMQGMMREEKPSQIRDHIQRLADSFSEGGLIFNLFPMPDIPLENMLAFRSALLGD